MLLTRCGLSRENILTVELYTCACVTKRANVALYGIAHHAHVSRTTWLHSWVMHDEATAHYVGMVDQTHLGHSFLKEEFGTQVLPTVGWQIDPFGHSATQASLLSAQVGR